MDAARAKRSSSSGTAPEESINATKRSLSSEHAASLWDFFGRGTIVYVVRGVRFVAGIGVRMLRDHTSQRVRFVTGIGVCML